MRFDLTTEDMDELATEGNSGANDLCKLAELMGYKDKGRYAINQLQCDNGAFVSSLLRFFEDNSGAIEAIHNWVRKNYAGEIEENDGADEEEGEENMDDDEDEDDE